MARRLAYGAAALASLIACIWLPFLLLPDVSDPDAGLMVFVLPLSLMIGFMLLFAWCFYKAVSDNIYNIKAGKVIAQGFTPAHMTQAIYIPGTPGVNGNPGTQPTYVPAMWVDNDWALQLEDLSTGRTGWRHFGSNVFDEYPIGSYYPRQTAPVDPVQS